MADVPIGIACPRCRKTLQMRSVARDDQLSACCQCGKRVLTDGRYQKALALATANEGWIEKVFWCERTNSLFSVVVVLFVEFPLTTLKFAGPVAVLLSLYFLRGDPFVATPGMPFRTWLLIPATVLAAYFILWFFKAALERWLFPNQFAAEANFIVSSRGLVILSQGPEPFLLPWSAIRNCAWSSDVGSMTSQIVIEYTTAVNSVARVILEGEERTQPLGELFDILDARFKQQPKG
jgi:hypothetical protein